VAFKNKSGPSPMSSWSAAVSIGGRAHPTLTLPQDPLKMTTDWWVYRQFSDNAGTMSPLKLIAIVPVSAAGTYTDNAHD
jgi:hypothetical protein